MKISNDIETSVKAKRLLHKIVIARRREEGEKTTLGYSIICGCLRTAVIKKGQLCEYFKIVRIKGQKMLILTEEFLGESKVMNHFPVEKIIERPKDIPPPHGETSSRTRGDANTSRALTASIKEHGLLNPIIMDVEYRVIDGNKRLSSCKEAGLFTVPVRVISDYVYCKRMGWHSI